MSLRKWLVVLVIGLVVISLSACSAVSDKIGEKASEKIIEKSTGGKVDINGGNVKIKSKDGKGELNVGSQKLPDSFPKDFPVYKGAKVEGSMTSTENGKTTMIVTLSTTDKYSAVADYYKSSLPNSGYTVASTMDVGQAITFGLKQGDEDVGGVVIADSDGKIGITITLTKK